MIDGVAFVTGGAQGIGLGIAHALAAEGAKVAIADVDAAALAVAGEHLSRSAQATTFELDVRDRDAYARAVDDAEARLGPISILCNNAGVGGGATVKEMTYDRWDWVIGVNLVGVVNGIQTIVPGMIERGAGHVVNTASGAGLVASGGGGFMYEMTKFGVVGLSESLRIDLARYGIGVSVLCPGLVATRIFDHSEALQPYPRDLSERQRTTVDRVKRSLLERGKDPDDVGRMVVDAIHANRLYVLTDHSVTNLVRRRADEIIASAPTTVAGGDPNG